MPIYFMMIKTKVFIMKKKEKFKGVANPEYHKAMVELRRSNAAGEHLDRRTKRERTRAASKTAAIKKETD